MTATLPPRPDAPAPEGLGPRVATWWRRDARFDVTASLVVFLVAVPLSLGIAAASGAPVAAGLIAAVVGGVVAGLVGGSPLQVSGPAAGLVVVVAETVDTFGWEVTCAITAAAGLLQLLLGVGRVGRYALAISPTVVRAMLAGIGASIVLGQLHVALGSTSRPTAWANLAAYPSSIADLQPHALVAAVAVVVVLLVWPRLPARVRVVPGPLAAIAGVTLLAYVALPDAARVDLGGSILSQVGLPDIGSEVAGISWLAFAGAVVTIAVIASVESLLSAVAVDKLHGGTRSDLDRELLGQGSANAVSGLVGGLPITGVIVRSATNVASGARTRASAVLHGVWVAVFSLLLVGLVEQIPLAALAGLLLVMGAQLVKPADMRDARRRGELWIYLVTVAAVLALNLVEGVMIGLALALLVVLWRVVAVRVEVREPTVADGLWVVEVGGTLSFLSVPRLTRGLARVPAGAEVEVDLLVDYLDAACEDAVEQWRLRHVASGGTVTVQRPAALGGDRPDKADVLSPRALLPWSSWQTDGAGPATERLAHGIREYHRRGTAPLAPVYEGLADGQRPDAFFLACVDSRVVPNLVTSSGPGDLFTVRTMGNLVPDAGSSDTSVSAPLAYALDQLEVPSVVVCGHSGCGAMQAALSPEQAEGPVGTWLEHAEPVLAAWRDGHPVGRAAAEAGESEADQLSQVTVAVMLERLRVQAGAHDDVAYVGLWLRVGDGTLMVLRPGEQRFVPLTDAEAHELGSLT